MSEPDLLSGRREARVDEVLSSLNPEQKDLLHSYIAGLESEVEELRGKVVEDPLTGIGNRRGYDSRLKTEVDRKQRYGGDLTILRIDCDGLKAINDDPALGHKYGDVYIRGIANILKASIRSTDYIARVGGDEFIVIVDGDQNSGEIVATRIQERVGKKIERMKKIAASKDVGRPIFSVLNQVVLKFGMTTESYVQNSGEGLSGKELDRQADAASYVVKKNAGKSGTGKFIPDGNGGMVDVQTAPYALLREGTIGTARFKRHDDGTTLRMPEEGGRVLETV